MTRREAAWLLAALATLPPAAAFAQAQTETVRVVAPRPSATGVTGTAAGGGLISEEQAAKSRSTVSVDFIAKQAPTANAFDLLRLTPGANAASTDAYGLSPGVNITLRGLNGDEVAYLLEGAPLNDIGYYAGYPSQWVDSENVRAISLAQGSADLDTPTVNATGGLIDVRLRDPAALPGGLISASYGSYHFARAFVRADTGAIGDTGVRGFVSFSQTQADNERGAGRDHRQHVDFRFSRDFADGSSASIVGSYHDADLSSYPNPSLADWHAYGRSYNYQAAFTSKGFNPVCADYGEPAAACYWKLYQQTWRDVQLSAPIHVVLGGALAWDTTPYAAHGFGNSPYGDILPTTPEAGLAQGTQPITQGLNLPNARDGQAIVLGDYIGNQYRAGLVTELTAHIGAHTIVGGIWYDYADDYDPQPFTPVGRNGDPASAWGFPFTVKVPGRRTNYSLQEAHTREQVDALFLGDTVSLLGGRMVIEAGLKYAMVNRDGTNSLPGSQYKVGLNSSEPLPRASVRYRIDTIQQVFASVSTNFRSPVEYVLYDSYDGYGDLLTKEAHQNDEYSISEELGYRYQGHALDAAITLFNYNFTNRQVATVAVQPGNGLQVGSNINAGGQTSRGVDAELGLRPVLHWRPYVSAEYLHATNDNDFATAALRDGQAVTDMLATAGKVAVRSPAFQGAIGLDYDDGTRFGNLSVKYTGGQYATFLNDEQIPGHAQADATLGYRLPDIGAIHRPEARLNFVNLTNAKFLSGIASVTPNAQAALGRHGGMIAGSAPAYYIGPGFAAVVTLAAGF